jgi:Na+/melibiose symporter-like transporter
MAQDLLRCKTPPTRLSIKIADMSVAKETLAYILFDVSKSFNIYLYAERFVFDVLNIDFYYLAIINFINTIWDVVNDTFTGVIVDKTRTRWGKFKPYLVVFAIPGSIGSCFYWLMPAFFPGTDGMDFTKFMVWLFLALFREGTATFQTVAETGMLATITPHPVDRTRLITKANFFSGFVEKIPEFLMGLFIDLINHNVISMKLGGAYMFMGVFTTVTGGAMAMIFFFTTRERVMQSVSARASLRVSAPLSVTSRYCSLPSRTFCRILTQRRHEQLPH